MGFSYVINNRRRLKPTHWVQFIGSGNPGIQSVPATDGMSPGIGAMYPMYPGIQSVPGTDALYPGIGAMAPIRRNRYPGIGAVEPIGRNRYPGKTVTPKLPQKLTFLLHHTKVTQSYPFGVTLGVHTDTGGG